MHHIGNLYCLEVAILCTDYEELYKSILKMDGKIRYATIFDMNGEIKYSGHRGDVTSLLTPTESKNSLQQAISAWKNRNEYADKIGKGKYVLAAYEKVKRITIPLDDDHLIYITTESDANHDNIIKKTLDLKKEFLHRPEGMP
ncbi:MAG: DUF6659 family protein [Nitrosotalea sp.]